MNTEIILSKPINQLPVVDLKTQILKLIEYCYAYAGYNLSGKEIELSFQVSELHGMLTTGQFKNLTLEDLKSCFKNGLSLKYGDFTGLSMLVYTKWINSFLNERKSGNMVMEHEHVKQRLAQQEVKPTEQQVSDWKKENFDFCFDFFTKNNKIPVMCQGAFDWARDNGMPITNEDWEFLKEVAKQKLADELMESKKQSVSISESKRLCEQLNQIKSDQMNVDSEARRLALVRYFTKLINGSKPVSNE